MCWVAPIKNVYMGNHSTNISTNNAQVSNAGLLKQICCLLGNEYGLSGWYVEFAIVETYCRIIDYLFD